MTSLIDAALPKADVELGGGAHSPQVRFTAPDTSVIWNGLPVEIACDPPVSTFFGEQHTDQITDFSFPDDNARHSDDGAWPPLYIAGYVDAVTAGLALQLRLTCTISANVNVAVVSVYGLEFDDSPPAAGGYDSGWIAMGVGCDAAIGPDYVLRPAFNCQVFPGGTVAGGKLQTRWVAGGIVASYAPFQPLAISFIAPNPAPPRPVPPTLAAAGYHHVTDPSPGASLCNNCAFYRFIDTVSGRCKVYSETVESDFLCSEWMHAPQLKIALPTTSCGDLTATWADIAEEVIAATPIDASYPNPTFATEIAVPTSGIMGGAIGSAAIKSGAGLPP